MRRKTDFTVIFYLILTAILCVQYFFSFGAMLFILNLLRKTDFTVSCVPCMLEYVCYEPFSLKNCRFRRYVNWLKFMYCLKFTCVQSFIPLAS